jgi:hypothetical protein
LWQRVVHQCAAPFLGEDFVVRFLREYGLRFMTDGLLPSINDRVMSRRYGQSSP